ncbi:hypothetical protein [Hymenobacter sp. YC55]|uniref:hypothetical protein n=1 Tax=Hymenobacter sp. YC55 TaxID=3034019 RepID=UPI0023F73100|nr:hypothetical protein [Hymenobacter sp. YC55]MDF7810760.1 hypothetical protein [Hymenobacter sp. YC55]
MPAVPTILIQNFSQSCTPTGGQISFYLRVTGGSGAAETTFWTLSKRTPTGQEVVYSGNKPGPYNSFSQAGIPNGEYLLDASSNDFAAIPKSVTISCAVIPPIDPPGDGGGGGGGGPIEPPVPTCNDPEADNYGSTANGGACVYSDRVTAEELPELVANGSPVRATLHSARVGGTPAKAYVDIYLQPNPNAGGVIILNGHRLEYGPLEKANRFLDAPSLAAALRAVPELVARHEIVQPSATRVYVMALEEGPAWNPVASTTDPDHFHIYHHEGAPRYHSQRRSEWGVYCEVWAGCGSDFGGVTKKSRAKLAMKLEVRYRPDNNYVFDIADALRQYTSHELVTVPGHIPSRMVSYFLRFGEMYADQPNGFRRRRNIYETGVKWALEAVEVPEELATGFRVLSTQPLLRQGGAYQVTYLLLSAAVASTLEVLATERDFAGATTTTAQDALPGITAMGGVYCFPWQFNPSKRTGTLGFKLQPGAEEIRVLNLRIAPADVRSLTFANRQGGHDTVVFAGMEEDSLKRSPATFQNGQGEQIRRVEVDLPKRLHSGLLELAYWRWLRLELASAPSGWIGQKPVTISDFDAQGDPIKAEYTASVEHKTAPIRGLSN